MRYSVKLISGRGVGRRMCLAAGWLLAASGCSSLQMTTTAPSDAPAGANWRRQLRERTTADLAAASQPAGAPTSQPATRPVSATSQPCELTPLNIIQLVYDTSPQVRASREEMDAAQHGLDEFKANLSRFEPFTEARGDATRFPERRDSRGTSGEIVGGIEKETFEGARFRIEGGASTSRVRFGEVEQDQDAVEEGSGGLVRGRIEVPFVGSRRRQERIINQAFQESRARQAKLTYLDAYREYAVSALQYYQAALLYQADAAAYEHKRRELATLRQNPRVRPEDRDRLDSSAADAVVYRDQYLNYRRDAILSLLAALGLGPDAPYVLVESEYAPSEYLDKSATQEGLARMIEDAYFNNPRFRVLDNAIRDAELQRQQAIVGRYDITAFVEGTQFPFGAETYDDRVGGWQVGAGVTVRLNDQRVLTASRLKAEAQIRAYQAQIETERLNIQRKISTHTSTLRSNHQVRLQLLENVKQKQAAFEYRTRVYLSGGPPPMTIDDVLIPLSEMISAEIQLASNAYYSGLADIAIMAATGEVYRLVGMAIDEAAEAASGP